jgi:hypothetical protein
MKCEGTAVDFHVPVVEFGWAGKDVDVSYNASPSPPGSL